MKVKVKSLKGLSIFVFMCIKNIDKYKYKFTPEYSKSSLITLPQKTSQSNITLTR